MNALVMPLSAFASENEKVTKRRKKREIIDSFKAQCCRRLFGVPQTHTDKKQKKKTNKQYNDTKLALFVEKTVK